MIVSIIVPFRSDGAERDRNWKFLKARYEALYPDWEIVEGTCEPPWRKGIAVNRAVNASSGEVLILCDADVLIAERALRDAVKRLETFPWVVPHRMVHRLTESATAALIDGRLRLPGPTRSDETIGSPKRGAPGGAIALMRREDFHSVSGIDERFVGWGGEDISFARALDTIVGTHKRLRDVIWHLYHEPLPRREGNRASPESEALAARYLEASANEVAMSDLTQERHEGMVGGGIVVARREVVQTVPLDSRFVGWG